MQDWKEIDTLFFKSDAYPYNNSGIDRNEQSEFHIDLDTISEMRYGILLVFQQKQRTS